MISQLDLVIAVDTSVAHLAGAMGKPVWVLLPHLPDWRWMLGRDDSPWYPSMRLFRQQSPGDWEPVIQSVVNELRAIQLTPDEVMQRAVENQQAGRLGRAMEQYQLLAATHPRNLQGH